MAAGVDAVRRGTDIVLVHDAARPFCPPALIDRTLDAAVETGAAVPAVRATDTVKQAAARDGRLVVGATLPREDIYLAQTPQAFRIEVLRDGRRPRGRSGIDATDEACLAERCGHAVRLVEGDPDNFKVTTPADLRRAAETVAGGPASRAAFARVGLGYDLHRTIAGAPVDPRGRARAPRPRSGRARPTRTRFATR